MAFSVKHDLPDSSRRPILSPVDIGAPGNVREIVWSPVAGATRVEVTQALLTISPSTAEEAFPDVPTLAAGNHRDVVVPEGRSVKNIGLDAVPAAGQRLTLSLPSARGGYDAPIFASQAVPNGSMAPDSPEGASLSNGLFSLPRPVTAAKFRLSMVTGDDVTEFSPVAFTLTKVNLGTSTPPRNVKVLGPDGAAIWESPQMPIGTPPAEIDLKVPLEFAFKAALADPRASITITADAPSRAYVDYSAIHGNLLRVEEGILRTNLDGQPRLLPLSSGLDAQQPAEAIGDLTVTYEGFRILETVSDEVPAVIGFAEGPIVGTNPVLRLFPPEALVNISPARIGVLGRAPEDCELALEFVPVTGNTPGPPIGPPAVLSLKASASIDLHWVDAPGGLTLGTSLGLQARANKGRFFWAANAGTPVLRLAISDPNPGGRPLYIGSTVIQTTNEPRSHTPGFAFPGALFRNGFPQLSSDLFLTVEISDLTLRYAR